MAGQAGQALRQPQGRPFDKLRAGKLTVCQASLRSHTSGDKVKDIVQHEQWNDPGHHTGADCPRSDTSHTEQSIKNPAQAGKGQALHDEPDYIPVRHDNLNASR